MEIRQMIDYHQSKGAELTVAAIPVPVEKARHFGIIEIDENGRMIGFEEKPQHSPKTIPHRPTHVLASMGNYVFDSDTLVNYLQLDAEDDASSHDFGRNIIPMMVPGKKVYVYDFSTNEIRGEPENSKGYWRDVGTLDAYYEANMDLISVTPPFDLYNKYWPLRSYTPPVPPAKFIHDDENRTGRAVNSAVAAGCIISGAVVKQSILGHRVHVHSHTLIEQSVIMGDTDIGKNCRIKRTIFDQEVVVADGTVIGEDPEFDRHRFHISENGIVVIPKGARVGFN
jgi:glucose-1-phosphate adenylyltransferase